MLTADLVISPIASVFAVSLCVVTTEMVHYFWTVVSTMAVFWCWEVGVWCLVFCLRHASAHVTPSVTPSAVRICFDLWLRTLWVDVVDEWSWCVWRTRSVFAVPVRISRALVEIRVRGKAGGI